jgi:DNA-binding NtrC family response regulator
MLRLVSYAPDGVRRFPIHRREMVIGSGDDCDVVLAYTGVAQHHARLEYDGETLEIHDLGSRRGTVVDGERTRQTTLGVLDEIRLGTVTLLVEDVAPEASVDELAADEPARPPEPPQPMDPARMLEHLSRISNWVLADAESRTTLESLTDDLLRRFGGGALFLFLGDLDDAGIKFVTASNPDYLAAGEELLEQVRAARQAEADETFDGTDILGGRGGRGARHLFFEGTLGGGESWIFHRLFSALDRPYFMVVALTDFDRQDWSPVPALFTLGDLLSLGLVHHVGRYEPILPGNRSLQGLTLEPRLVVGESDVMQDVVERLRAAVDTGTHVLLRGEPGVGKELLARSIHLSSSRRNGPFVVASAQGASPTQVEADLFGAEIAARDRPVRREGKLLLADGGTLLLNDVDRLPLELQDRLVRFLRSGEVEPAGSREARTVDVRLVATSRRPLEPAVARDEFRVDLAYRLSRFAIDVPSLRDRRADLPLLVQSYVNRFCHESGKRLAGITTKAQAALLAYDYPGNLDELENIARQMVYLCPNGRPVELSILPDAVRDSPIQSMARVDEESDLKLERLVASCELAAIREALRRTNGNKSQSARLLGLSRNGLSMKMERLGLTA